MEHTVDNDCSERVDEILDNCGLVGEYVDVDEGEFRVRDGRSLLRPLAREIATLGVDLRQCTRRDARYFNLLRAYESALKALKQCCR